MILYENKKVYVDGEYPAIFLHNKNEHIHKLEWKKYFGNIPKGFIIHHINNNKFDWNITNLELLSRSDHIKKHKSVVKRKGHKIIAYKENYCEVFNSIKECAIKCDTYESSINRILKNKQKTANGFNFRLVGG